MSRRETGKVDFPAPRDDSTCTILHVDMDAFYASVELLSRPMLRGLPVIVGGSGSRGVVLSATYEARAFGVRAAMPTSRARRLCPQATVIAPDHRRYARVSEGVMQIFRSFTVAVEPLSLDEAFLDIAGAVRRHGSPTAIAELLRARVFDEQGITCSVGGAPNKFVAKVASAHAKPDGMLLIPADSIVAFLHPLPVGALWGVGPRTEEQLHHLGVRTVADVAHLPRPVLRRALGAAAGNQLAELSWGRDGRRVDSSPPDRSIGSEHTFAGDVDDPDIIHRELLALSDQVAARLRAAGWVGRTVSIKVRFADFTTITRSRTMPEATDVGRTIYTQAAALYDALGLQRARLRLVGVRVERLTPAGTSSHQIALDEPEAGWREAETAVDRAVARFGDGVVRPASLLRRGEDEP
ncbi:MAG TPA: DNA polymerase IV [Actinomycetota bacterium]|nr:DNA polymerase IV [Actinomycetota bacterium]